MRIITTNFLLSSLFLAACAGPNNIEISPEDIARIEQTLVQGSELAWELTQAESQVAKTCMEDLGFSIHNPVLLHGGLYPSRFEGFSSPYSQIPTLRQAEKFGFGIWLHHNNSAAAETIRKDPDYLAFAANNLTWQDPNEETAISEWKSASPEYQQTWLEAFIGIERLEFNQSFSPEMLEDGEIINDPPFSGCELFTIKKVYGDPIHREVETGYIWTRPDLQNPLTWIVDGEVYSNLSNKYDNEERKFLTCIESHSYDNWMFDAYGYLPINAHIDQLYQDTQINAGSEQNFATPRSNTSDPKEYEIRMAINFAECAESSGLRNGSEEIWAQMHVEILINWEAEIKSWKKDIEEYLLNARSYISD